MTYHGTLYEADHQMKPLEIPVVWKDHVDNLVLLDTGIGADFFGLKIEFDFSNIHYLTTISYHKGEERLQLTYYHNTIQESGLGFKFHQDSLIRSLEARRKETNQ